MITVSEFEGQGSWLPTVHWKILLPILKFETPEMGFPGLAMMPEPLTRLQTPVPVNGAMAFRLLALLQILLSAPAMALEGPCTTVSKLLSITEGQLLVAGISFFIQ